MARKYVMWLLHHSENEIKNHQVVSEVKLSGDTTEIRMNTGLGETVLRPASVQSGKCGLRALEQ